ncbi:MAG: hypothetical protein KDA41_07870 [Planctomycetales bacterium]|nr:hypothetical protein [Planctomycetales bacterium]
MQRIATTALLMSAGLAALGCRSDPSVALMEAELRWMEDQYYLLESQYNEKCRELEHCRSAESSSGGSRRTSSGQGAGSPARGRSVLDQPGAGSRPPNDSGEPPTFRPPVIEGLPDIFQPSTEGAAPSGGAPDLGGASEPSSATRWTPTLTPVVR